MSDRSWKKWIPRFKQWLTQTRARTRALKSLRQNAVGKGAPKRDGGRWKRKGRVALRHTLDRIADLDFKKIELSKLTQHSALIRWTLIVIAIYLASNLGSQIIGLFLKPVYMPIPKKTIPDVSTSETTEDYTTILDRNMFNVDGKIPEPFDQGLLDCMSQAKATTQRVLLLGTIVMNDEKHSVALIQEEGNPLKVAVKKDDLFADGRFQAMKVDRRKLCFQVKATQEFEFIEIPDDSAALGLGGPSLEGLGSSSGITPISASSYSVKRNFLEEKLSNLNEILQSAKAVPYVEGGKFRGFLIQSIEPGSPFAQLGIAQGDVLLGVNDILLDNAGKGLEAFQRLRNSPRVSLKISRGGQEQTLTYDVQ